MSPLALAPARTVRVSSASSAVELLSARSAFRAAVENREVFTLLAPRNAITEDLLSSALATVNATRVAVRGPFMDDWFMEEELTRDVEAAASSTLNDSVLLLEDADRLSPTAKTIFSEKIQDMQSREVIKAVILWAIA